MQAVNHNCLIEYAFSTSGLPAWTYTQAVCTFLSIQLMTAARISYYLNGVKAFRYELFKVLKTQHISFH